MKRSLAVGIPLPDIVKKSIALISHGLPDTDWLDEENLYVILYQIDSCEGDLLLDVDESLKEFYFPIFEIALNGIAYKLQQGRRGSLWINVQPSEPLNKICRELSRTIGSCIPQNKNRQFPPFIPLASFQRLSPLRLSSYLEANTLYSHPPFPAESIALLAKHSTPKKIYYHEEEMYPLIK